MPALSDTLAGPDAVEHAELAAVVRLSPELTAEYLEHHAVLPLRRDEERVLVVTWTDSVNVTAVDDLRILFGAPVQLVRGPEPEIRGAIRRAYGRDGVTAQQLIAGLSSEEKATVGADPALDDLVSQANEAPVIRLVNLLLLEALEARASDVHLEMYASGIRARYRIDGLLENAPSPPQHLGPAVISRLKIMAELDIAERRVPQDGRIRLHLQDRQVDVRVATLPTLHGESVVLRLLDRESGRIALEDLGMATDTRHRFLEVVSRPHGIVLVTGPTGSGKTTSLYAAVDHVRTGREKILTVEDPVEYELEGVPQVPVNEKVGVTFATALRALLRQDPDILLVGEVRDEETADIATHAALTGHLVLSTLHTNDATSALTRLLDLGVAPYLVASTLEAVLAQRLVRRICDACRQAAPMDPVWPEAFGVPEEELSGVQCGAGCQSCRGTGYRGRTGIYELLVMNDHLRREVLQRKDDNELRRNAVLAGMETLREDGLRLVREGTTTPAEVLRITRL
jgi:general secretion pathway protein E